MNHDAYLIEPVIDKLLAILKQNPKTGIISPFHLGSSEINLESQFEKFMYQQGVSNKVYCDLTFRKSFGSYEVDFIPAASWFMDVKMILRVGYFHKLFFHYGEDNNYLQRVKFWDYKTMVTNELHIVHIGYQGKRNYLKNYSGYHELTYKANFLVNFLDINTEFELHKLIRDLTRDCHLLFRNLLKIKFNVVINLWKILIWKLKLVSALKSERDFLLKPRNIN